MPNQRRRSKHARPHRPLGSHHPVTQTRRDGEWLVRGIPEGSSTKVYRCPGCHQLIAVGTAHVVVWPRTASLGSSSAIDERRHWHRGCWVRRA
ncbi:MAG TPA: hypothetical protein GXZ30_10195 [Propionibacterium sp.]|nr:hypothetical protein [Propionibacterium sp.]